MGGDCRDSRQQEINQLTAEGKVPHEVELEKHPEKSMEGRMCMYGHYVFHLPHSHHLSRTGLMGKVAGSIKVSLWTRTSREP